MIVDSRITHNNVRYLLASILLLLGILNPVGGNVTDGFVAFFVFGLVGQAVIGKNKLFLILIIAAAIGLFWQVKGFDLAVVCGMSAGVLLSSVLEKFKLGKLRILFLIPAFLVASFATSGDLREMLSRDLPYFTYNNDPSVFLKTYQLVDSGQPYYLSLLRAHDGRFSRVGMPTDIWGLRMPTLFYIWSFLPGGGMGIYFLFLVISASVLFGAYKVTEKYLGRNIGLLSSYLLFPYLHYAARDQMMLETEWWGVTIFIIGIHFLLFRKYFLSTILLSLSTLTRELFIMPVFLLLIYYFFTNRKIVYIATVPITAFCLFFLFHLTAANFYIDAYGSLLKPRVIPLGYMFLQQTFAFGSWEYFFYNFKPFFLFFILAVMGSLYVYLRKSKTDGLIILFSFLIFPIAFLKIGTLPYNDYWGIMFMPQVLIFAPVVLGNFLGDRD